MTAPARTISPITVRFTDYPSLVDAFRAIKDHIAISNSELDALCNFGAGQVDKILGPTSTKGFGKLTLNAMLWALCIKGTLEIDLSRIHELEQHWEQRCAFNIRTTPVRVSKKLIKTAAPIVFEQYGRIGGMVTAHMRTPAQRSESARKAAKSRWKKVRKIRVRCRS